MHGIFLVQFSGWHYTANSLKPIVEAATPLFDLSISFWIELSALTVSQKKRNIFSVCHVIASFEKVSPA